MQNEIESLRAPGYQYAQLNRSPMDIRLMKIEPSDKQDSPLALTIAHHPISSPPKYLALSYTWDRPSPAFPEDWDDPDNTRPISLNEQPFQVRVNLHAALVHIRATMPGDRFVWWVDAISINQQDIGERNFVVPRMSDIYTGAYATVIWLGPEDKHTELAFNHIAEVSKSWQARPPELSRQLFPGYDICAYLEFFKREFPEDTASQKWEAIATIWDRSWWRRAWIVQELLLSRIVYIICGQYSLGWGHLKDTVLAQEQFSIISNKVQHPLLDKVKTLYRLSITRIGPFYDLRMAMQAYQMDLAEGRKLTLLAALPFLRRADCKNPRDKVYAALGLVEDKVEVQVDYSLPVDEIYTRLARSLLEESATLSILSQCHSNLGSDAPSNLPSWVPDWTVAVDLTSEPLPQRGLRELRVRSTRNEPFYYVSSTLTARFDDDSRTLILRGIIIDEVVFISSITGSTLQSQDRLGELWWNFLWLREWVEFKRGGDANKSPIQDDNWKVDLVAPGAGSTTATYTVPKDALAQAYLRTIVADMRYDKPLTRGQKIVRLDRDTLDGFMADPILTWAGGRRFAATQRSTFALAPATTRVGDKLAVIEGSEIPLILRDAGDGYRLVGQCYANGLMGDEGWNLASERADVEVRDIRII